MKDISGYDIEKMLALVSEAGRMVIVTHVKPDGDAMGSSIGLQCFLNESFGKKATIVLPGRYPGNHSASGQIPCQPRVHDRRFSGRRHHSLR